MTNSRFISVKKSDPQFYNYLLGNNQDGLRPIPVRSLNVGLEDEVITFEMKPVSEIKKPNILEFIFGIAKIKSYLLIFLPLFFVLAKNLESSQIVDPFSLAFAAAAMIFTFAGLNMRNDISDHVSGFDRVNISSKPKPILAGWITANQLSKLSWIAIGFGVLFAVPVLLLQFQIWKVLVCTGSLVLLGQFFQKNSYKEKDLGELILFLLMGIGIAVGFQVAFGVTIDIQIVAFGIFWGSVVLFLVHINNFGHLLTSTQAGIKNSITKLGFDRAKIFLAGWWSLCLILWTWFHFEFALSYWKWLGTLFLVVVSIPLFRKLSRVRSPLSSDLIQIRQHAYTLFLLLVFLFFVEHLCYLWSLWKL